MLDRGVQYERAARGAVSRGPPIREDRQSGRCASVRHGASAHVPTETRRMRARFPKADRSRNGTGALIDPGMEPGPCRAGNPPPRPSPTAPVLD